jgi:hypothetical protein
MDAALQVLEADRIAITVERDDLAVEQHRPVEGAGRAAQRVGDLGKLLRLLVAQPRPQLHDWRRRRHDRQGADAVVLRLVGKGR